MIRPTMSMGAYVLSVMAVFGPAGAHAGDGEPGEVLKKHGLKAMGPLYVLDGEAEAKKKYNEFRLLSRKLEQALKQQASVMTPQAQQGIIQDLNAQIGQIRGEINLVGQQTNRMPRYRGRWSGYYNQQQNADLNAYRAELNAALNQRNAMLAQVRAQKPDSKLKDKTDGEVKTLRDQRLMAARELDMVVKTTREKYADLATNAEVKKEIATLGLTVKPSPHLGPSHEFHEIARFAEKIEKDLGGSPFEPKTKAAHKTKRAGRSRHRPDPPLRRRPVLRLWTHDVVGQAFQPDGHSVSG